MKDQHTFSDKELEFLAKQMTENVFHRLDDDNIRNALSNTYKDSKAMLEELYYIKEKMERHRNRNGIGKLSGSYIGGMGCGVMMVPGLQITGTAMMVAGGVIRTGFGVKDIVKNHDIKVKLCRINRRYKENMENVDIFLKTISELCNELHETLNLPMEKAYELILQQFDDSLHIINDMDFNCFVKDISLNLAICTSAANPDKLENMVCLWGKFKGNAPSQLTNILEKVSTQLKIPPTRLLIGSLSVAASVYLVYEDIRRLSKENPLEDEIRKVIKTLEEFQENFFSQSKLVQNKNFT